MSHPEPVARRMYDLVEPLGLVPYFADESDEALMALGLRHPWDAYFAGRAAPLGRDVPADVVHAIFYNFAPGEVARHIPRIWELTTPEAALAARERGCVAGIRRILGELADAPGVARAADLLLRAATSARVEGRPLYAALRAVPVPEEPVARLWHAATLLREHRGDGHIAALLAEGIGGTEAHVLHALSIGMPAHEFGRVHHLPAAQLAAVVDGMRARGLIETDGWLTPAGRATKERVEALTDRLAEAPYDALGPEELDRLVADLEPIAAAFRAVFPF
ncbi:MarR family transcriptional regulator [Amycolatopsis sp. OK19-0408]|uniref:MarR family transcriptional regulator n=1 Tax=Amycolatopsis iheyensis TaxID=2945988 RepID=A0A9X2NMN5_9PSEU|nr:MarR family transcriptional regulator [Amycolatopsis iheyensis]MCR6489182.1 MarR family transcriptional regulator [Amycolatopsis iheyensis]